MPGSWDKRHPGEEPGAGGCRETGPFAVAGWWTPPGITLVGDKGGFNRGRGTERRAVAFQPGEEAEGAEPPVHWARRRAAWISSVFSTSGLGKTQHSQTQTQKFSEYISKSNPTVYKNYTPRLSGFIPRMHGCLFHVQKSVNNIERLRKKKIV